MNTLTSPLAYRHHALIAALVLAGLAGACRATPATPAASADAWAVVDGREIKRDEVEKTYRRTAQEGANPSEEEQATAKLGILNELIVQDLLLAKAPLQISARIHTGRSMGLGHHNIAAVTLGAGAKEMLEAHFQHGGS